MGRMTILDKSFEAASCLSNFQPTRKVGNPIGTYYGYGNVAESLPSMKFVEPC